MTDSFPVRVPFSEVCCSEDEVRLVTEVINSGWLTTGPKVQEFEKRFARMVGCKFALAVNSCTAALHLAAEAMGIGPGDKVLVPTMTFTASAEVIRYLGADPVFLDVEYGTSLITPQGIEDALGRCPDTKAVMVVHFGGQGAQMFEENGQDGILDVCRKQGVRVIEDAAHAFPAMANGRFIGSIGDATCFSFYANKTITTGEGGMLTTDDPDLAARASVMRLHGIDRDAWDRYSTSSKRPGWEYDIVAPGFKYNMPDMAAAIGLAQLEKAEAMRASRERVARRYFERLANIDCLDLPVFQCGMDSHAWHLFPIVLTPAAPVSRDQLNELLWERGIRTSVHYKPLHRMTYYQKTYALTARDFPSAERIWAGCLSLPIYPSLSEGSIDYVCDRLREFLDGR